MKADQETLYWTVRVDTLMCQFCCRIPRSGCHRDKTRSAVVGITNWQILKLRLFFLSFLLLFVLRNKRTHLSFPQQQPDFFQIISWTIFELYDLYVSTVACCCSFMQHQISLLICVLPPTSWKRCRSTLSLCVCLHTCVVIFWNCCASPVGGYGLFLSPGASRRRSFRVMRLPKVTCYLSTYACIA